LLEVWCGSETCAVYKVIRHLIFSKKTG